MAFGKAKPPVDVAWRPDFRMPDRLPDIKPVRTDFFINFAALSFALFAIFVTFFQEYNIQHSSSEISRKLDELRSKASKQDEYFRDNVAFTKHEATLKEFVLFYSKQISVSDLLVLLSRETPKGITLESVRQSPQPRDKVIVTAIEISGYVRDSDTTRADVSLEQFLQTLFASKELKGKNIRHEKPASDFVRDVERGVVKFKVRIEISPQAPTPVKPPTK